MYNSYECNIYIFSTLTANRLFTTTRRMSESDSLAALEGFLNPDFDSFKAIRDLLLATNDVSTSELDIETSIKRLTFDGEEVEKRMSKLSSQNYEKLIGNFDHIGNTNAIMQQKVNPQIERVNNSFSKIKSEVVEPYNKAVTMNAALRKIHTTADLLRGSNFFFHLILNIEELDKNVDSDGKRNANDLIKLTKLCKQLNELYEQEKDSSRSKELGSSLLSVNLIRDYQSIQISKSHRISQTCLETITELFDHHSTFNPENDTLKKNLIAYYILNEDDLLPLIERVSIQKQVQVCSSQLSRSLQSPRNLIVILKEVKQSSDEFVEKLSKILSSCILPDEKTSILDIYLQQSRKPNVSEVYWPKLVIKFKRTIASTMARGGPIAKNLGTYYEGIVNSIKEIFDDQVEPMLQAVEIIKHRK